MNRSLVSCSFSVMFIIEIHVYKRATLLLCYKLRMWFGKKKQVKSKELDESPSQEFWVELFCKESLLQKARLAKEALQIEHSSTLHRFVNEILIELDVEASKGNTELEFYYYKPLDEDQARDDRPIRLRDFDVNFFNWLKDNSEVLKRELKNKLRCQIICDSGRMSLEYIVVVVNLERY